MLKKDKTGRGGFGSALVAGGLVIAALVIAGVLGWTLLGSPFSTNTVDRSAAPVLTEIRDLSEFHAAQGDFNVLVDLEKDVKYVPSFIAGERALYIGVGTVDAYVDFSTIGQDAIVVSPDGKSVTVTLPTPALEQPVMDMEQSHVASRKRGLINRVGGLFSDSPTSEADLVRAAQAKLADAAAASDLRKRAEDNTRRMLEQMLTRLGYERVDVVFVSPAEPSA